MTSELIQSISKEIHKIKQEAKRIMRKLPNYDTDVPIPDADLIYSWIEGLCSTPHRRPGTSEGHLGEEWILNRFREVGLQNLTKDKISITIWKANRWNLKVEGEEISSFFILNTGFTGSEGITAPMIYVGEGQQKDFEEKDINGKIVVADLVYFQPRKHLVLTPSRSVLLTGSTYFITGPKSQLMSNIDQVSTALHLNFPGEFFKDILPKNLTESAQLLAQLFEKEDVYRNALNRGAIAIVLILRDQPSKNNSLYGPYDAVLRPIPGLYVGKYEGIELRELAKQGKEATLILQGKIEPGFISNIWGVLPGQSEESIIITSHHDSPHKGATEDGTGLAQVLAQAWSWSQIPMEKRTKTLVFVAAAGHMQGGKGSYSFAHNHDEIMNRAKVLITLEHLAAKEVKEGSKGEYLFTGNITSSIMFTSDDPTIVAIEMKALSKKLLKSVVLSLSTGSSFIPSDAGGYFIARKIKNPEKPLSLISWVSAPYYLLDEEDTLDKVEKSELVPVAETVTEIVKNFMALK